MISASHLFVCLSMFVLTQKAQVDSMPPFRAKNATTFPVAKRAAANANFRHKYSIFDNSVRTPVYNSMRTSAYNSARTSAYNAVRTPAYNAVRTSAYNSARTSAYNSARTSAYNSARTSAYNSVRVASPPAYNAVRITPPPASITYGTVYGPSPWNLLSQMGEDEYQIRRFIQTDARALRIHPLQFDKERFKRAVVQISNRYRWMHGTDGLVPDTYSEVGATRWADGLARSGSCLVHELRHGGENLFYFSTLEPYLSTPETMAEAVMKSFYIEGRNYMRYAFPSRPDPSAYHYTQMLWRGSRRIGVGVSIQALPSGGGPCVPYAYGYNSPQAWMFYVDIRYDPIGNQAYPGNGYTENVLPLVRRM
ncbi:hypothetical protein GPALN_011378 [Globodera pallida]|nr:hypothetical protein GPALN_011378 [Globodera pallida]